MKKVSRILKIGLILFVLISFYCASFADTWDTALEVVKKASNVKYFEEGQANLTHEIISCDKKAGEIKLRLTLTNTSEGAEEDDEAPTEVYIILSENLVKLDGYKNYCSYIETLAKKIFAKSAKTKIGIIGMKGPVYDWTMSEDGTENIRGDKDEGEIDGTADNSEVVIKATNNIDDLKSALQNMNPSKTEYYANLQSALMEAEKTFSSDANKILISLYDNVPSVSVGTHDKINLEVGEGPEEAKEKVIARNDQLVENTKKEIMNLKSAGIDLIMLRPKNSSFDQKWYSYTTGELILTFDGSEHVQRLYGTTESPTYGKMYSLEYDSLSKIVTEYIYADIMSSMSGIMTNIKVREYLTKEIMDNFTMTIDDVDSDVDTSNLASSRYFTWNIGKLGIGETAILNYTLRIKDMQNTAIFDKILSINEKIDISYEDPKGEPKQETENSSPQVKLIGIRVPENTVKNTNTNTNKPAAPVNNTAPKNTADNTTAPTILPATGSRILVAVATATTIIVGFVLYIKYRKLDDVQ